MSTGSKVVAGMCESTRKLNPHLFGGPASDSRLALDAKNAGAAPALESDLHEDIADYCRKRGYYFIHSRMDRRTTISVGAPDFGIALPGGRMVWLECKRPGGKTTVKQEAALMQLRKLGHTAFVVENFRTAQVLMEVKQ